MPDYNKLMLKMKFPDKEGQRSNHHQSVKQAICIHLKQLVNGFRLESFL